MKKILTFFAGLVFTFSASAQCSNCTPTNCSSLKPQGGLCNTLPDDTVGNYYDQVISFYMPKRLTDTTTLSQCGGCSSVDLRRIDIVGIQGLPPGLSFTPSQNGSYNVQGGDSLGCVHFCGTPIAPGTYYVIVNLLADVTANGTPLGSVSVDDQPQSYRDTLTIFPSTSACPTSFTLGQGPCITTSCEQLSVDLNGTITNPYCSNLISYDWDFGNGSTSHAKTPGIINYTTPDTFPLTLTTTYYTYRVKTVTVQCLGGWAGDIEEATTAQDPEPFIKINSLGFSNKSTATSGRNKTFSNLNLEIPYSNCATPLEIEVWDLDESIAPTISPSDLLSTHTVTPSVPNQVTSNLANSNIAVTFDTVATSSIVETVNIIVNPLPPTPVIVLPSDSICAGDSVLAEILPVLSGYTYTWVQNDTIELFDNDSAVYINVPGEYYVRITNLATGCTETSQKKMLYVGQKPPSTVNILFNGTAAFVSPFPASGFSVDWFYNGNFVPGQHGKFLNYLGDGLYEAQVYNTSFPNCRTVANSTNVISGISDIESTLTGLQVYPNPNSGQFTLSFSTEQSESISVKITNPMGQMTYRRDFTTQVGQFSEMINLENAVAGLYFVSIETKAGILYTKVIVQ